jgi:hypothetical protein
MKNTGLNLDGQVQLNSRQEQNNNSTSNKKSNESYFLSRIVLIHIL